MIAKVRRRDTSREIPDERASLVVSIILKSSTENHSQNGSGRFRHSKGQPEDQAASGSTGNKIITSRRVVHSLSPGISKTARTNMSFLPPRCPGLEGRRIESKDGRC